MSIFVYRSLYAYDDCLKRLAHSWLPLLRTRFLDHDSSQAEYRSNSYYWVTRFLDHESSQAEYSSNSYCWVGRKTRTFEIPVGGTAPYYSTGNNIHTFWDYKRREALWLSAHSGKVKFWDRWDPPMKSQWDRKLTNNWEAGKTLWNF